MAIYRDRKEPYPVIDLEQQAYFQTHDPAEWSADEAACNRYERVYGRLALLRALRLQLVCENIKPEHVYGKGWTANVYVDKPDVELPRPPFETGTPVSRIDQAIIDRLDLIIKLLRKE